MTKSLAAALALAAICVGPLWADTAEVEDMKSSIAGLKAHLADQERRLAELETAQQRDAEYAKVIEELRADAAGRPGGPAWLENLKFSGDLRLRYQGECFSGNNDKNRNRARVRLRFGFVKKWMDDQMEVGFRLASGESTARNGQHILSDATSTNQTLTDNFSEKSIWIDRAYAKYTPNGAFKGLTIIGGKFGVPLVSTNLIWDGDVNLEGAYVEYKRAFGCVEPFAGVGYFIAQESGGGHDVILTAYQGGARVKFTEDVKWTSAATFYDYDHYDEGYLNAYGNRVAVDGDLAAGQFHVINFTNFVDFKVFDLPWTAYLDYAHNCGNSDQLDAWDDQDDAYAVGLKVGKNKKKGDWSAGYKYAYIEANSVPGGFNDGDFGHSNRKGHVWNAAYNLTDYLTLGGAVLWLEPVIGDAIENQRDTVVQADLIWKF